MTDVDTPTDLDKVGVFIKTMLASRTIIDSVSGNEIPVPVQEVKITTGTTRGDDGVVQQTLHFNIVGDKSSELNQPAILKATESVLSQVPTLSQNFNLSDDNGSDKPRATAHNWRDDTKLDVTFKLPANVQPADVVKEIRTLAQGAAMINQTSATPAASAATPAASAFSGLGPTLGAVEDATVVGAGIGALENATTPSSFTANLPPPSATHAGTPPASSATERVAQQAENQAGTGRAA